MRFRLLPLAGVAILVAATLGAARIQRASGIDPSSLQPAVHPRDDLYEHVNAVWLSRTGVPPEYVTYNSFVELGEKVEADILAIVRDLAARPRDRAGRAERQVVDLYASVTDEAAIEARGGAPLQPQLDRIARIRNVRELATEAGRLSSLAAGGPFAGTLMSDPLDPARLMVQVTPGGTLLPERARYFASDAAAVETRSRYLAYLTTLFRLTGKPDPAGDAARVLALETVLARAQETAAAARDEKSATARFTFPQLSREMPGFDWEAWGTPQGLVDSGGVILAQPAFFRKFAELVAAGPLDTWKSWLAARYLTWASPYVSNAFSNARFEFFGRFLTGQEAPRPRWRRGVAMVNGYLPDVMGRLYVEKHFPRASRERVERMVGQIRLAFKQALTEANWLTPPARRAALDKLARLRTRVGYPDAWRDYRRLAVEPDDLLGNIHRAQAFDNEQQMLRATGRGDSRHWPAVAQTVNALYSAGTNEIVLPAGILQPPFFDPAADDAVNFGAIGGIIGHELMHGFDARGRHFDGTGGPRDWWTPADEQAYGARTAGLVAQFDSYPRIAGTPVDGKLTYVENAADLGGLSIALRAYRLSLDGRPSEQIDGWSGEQRFFLGWARAWRASVRAEYMRQSLLSDVHAPPRYRVNGPVSHMPEFHEAFGVKEGDRMYRPPSQRIRIW